MNTKNEKHLLAKVAAVMLLGMATIGGTSSVNAAGLTGLLCRCRQGTYQYAGRR